MQLLIELSKGGVIKLLAVFDYKDSREAKVTNNASLDKVVDILLNDWGKWVSLDPLDEVVDCHNEEFFCPVAYKKGPRMSIPH